MEKGGGRGLLRCHSARVMLPARRLHATFSLRRYRDFVLCSTNLRVCPTAIIVYGRHSYRRIRTKGDRHARRACWLRRGHTNSRRSHPRHQSRTNIGACLRRSRHRIDRKSTRLNSSHQIISYAVFCLKKKKKSNEYHTET